jgi:arabinogalactan endo-1,4-beta-galactosidase
MIRAFAIVVVLVSFLGCGKEETRTQELDREVENFISAVDISSYPEIETSGVRFYDLENDEDGFLSILKGNGVNTIRLRLWVHPKNQHSGFDEVKEFSRILKTYGFKIWLTLHYSDTWADPGHQVPPSRWQGIGFTALKDSVYQYTARIVNQIHPDFVQIGNEINSGLLHPMGSVDNLHQFKELLNSGIAAVRNNTTSTQLVMHYAGIKGAEWFFKQIDELDYDIIGLSYYPLWHGKDLDDLRIALQQLSAKHDKNVVIAETAYPFTLGYNDWTNNVVGLEDQLILPEFPATPKGQRDFVRAVKEIVLNEAARGIGFCYWGGELISWKGKQAQNASSWENQALFDFENKALPVLREFQLE